MAEIDLKKQLFRAYFAYREQIQTAFTAAGKNASELEAALVGEAPLPADVLDEAQVAWNALQKLGALSTPFPGAAQFGVASASNIPAATPPQKFTPEWFAQLKPARLEDAREGNFDEGVLYFGGRKFYAEISTAGTGLLFTIGKEGEVLVHPFSPKSDKAHAQLASLVLRTLALPVPVQEIDDLLDEETLLRQFQENPGSAAQYRHVTIAGLRAKGTELVSLGQGLGLSFVTFQNFLKTPFSHTPTSSPIHLTLQEGQLVQLGSQGTVREAYRPFTHAQAQSALEPIVSVAQKLKALPANHPDAFTLVDYQGEAHRAFFIKGKPGFVFFLQLVGERIYFMGIIASGKTENLYHKLKNLDDTRTVDLRATWPEGNLQDVRINLSDNFFVGHAWVYGPDYLSRFTIEGDELLWDLFDSNGRYKVQQTYELPPELALPNPAGWMVPTTVDEFQAYIAAKGPGAFQSNGQDYFVTEFSIQIPGEKKTSFYLLLTVIGGQLALICSKSDDFERLFKQKNVFREFILGQSTVQTQLTTDRKIITRLGRDGGLAKSFWQDALGQFGPKGIPAGWFFQPAQGKLVKTRGRVEYVDENLKTSTRTTRNARVEVDSSLVPGVPATAPAGQGAKPIDPHQIKVPTHADEFNALVQAKIPGVFYVGNRAFYALKGVNSAALALMSLNSKGSVVFFMVGDQNPHPQLTERILQAVQTGQAASGIEIKLEEDKLDGNLWIKLKVLGTESNPGTPAQFTTVFQPFSDALTVVNQQFTVQASSDAVTLSDAGSGELLVTFVPFERPAPVEDKAPAVASPQSWKVPTTAAEFEAHVKAGGPGVFYIDDKPFIYIPGYKSGFALATVKNGRFVFNVVAPKPPSVFDAIIKVQRSLIRLLKETSPALRKADFLHVVPDEDFAAHLSLLGVDLPNATSENALFITINMHTAGVTNPLFFLREYLQIKPDYYRQENTGIQITGSHEESFGFERYQEAVQDRWFFPRSIEEFDFHVKSKGPGVLTIQGKPVIAIPGEKGSVVFFAIHNGKLGYGVVTEVPKLADHISGLISGEADSKSTKAIAIEDASAANRGPNYIGQVRVKDDYARVKGTPLAVRIQDIDSLRGVGGKNGWLMLAKQGEEGNPEHFDWSFLKSNRIEKAAEGQAKTWKVPTTAADFDAHVAAGGPGIFKIEDQTFVRVPTDNPHASVVFTVLNGELLAHICADPVTNKALKKLAGPDARRGGWKWVSDPRNLSKALDKFEQKALVPMRQRLAPETRAQIKAVLSMPTEATSFGLSGQVLYFQPLSAYPYLVVSAEGVSITSHEYTNGIAARVGFGLGGAGASAPNAPPPVDRVGGGAGNGPVHRVPQNVNDFKKLVEANGPGVFFLNGIPFLFLKSETSDAVLLMMLKSQTELVGLIYTAEERETHSRKNPAVHQFIGYIQSLFEQVGGSRESNRYTPMILQRDPSFQVAFTDSQDSAMAPGMDFSIEINGSQVGLSAGHSLELKAHRVELSDGQQVTETFVFPATVAASDLVLPDLTPILPGLNKNHPKVFYITKDDGSLVTCVKLDLHSSSKRKEKTVAFLGMEKGANSYILFADEKVEELEKTIQTALAGNRIVPKGAWPKFQSHKMVIAPEVEQGKEVRQRDGNVTRLFVIRDGHVFITSHEVMDGLQMRGGGQVNTLDIQSFSVENPAVPFEPTVDGDFGKPVSPVIPGLSDANAYSFMKENGSDVDPSNCVYLSSFLSGQDEFFGILEFDSDGKVQLHVYDHRDKDVVRFANTLFGILAEPTGKIINQDEWIAPKFSLDLTRALKLNIPAFQSTVVGAAVAAVKEGRLDVSWGQAPQKNSVQLFIPGFPIVPVAAATSPLPEPDAQADLEAALKQAVADFNAIERPSEFELSFPPTWERRKWEQVAHAPIPIWMRFLKGNEIKTGGIVEVKIGSANATPVSYDLVATADGFELGLQPHLKGDIPEDAAFTRNLILRNGRMYFSFHTPELVFLNEVFGPRFILTWMPDKKVMVLDVKGVGLAGELEIIAKEFQNSHSLEEYQELIGRLSDAYQKRMQHPQSGSFDFPEIAQLGIANLLVSMNPASPTGAWPIAMKNIKPDGSDLFHIEGLPLPVRMQIAVAGRGNLPLNQFLGKSWDAMISIWWGNSEKPMTYKAKREGTRFVLTPQNGTPKGNVYLNNVEKGESKLSVEENSDLAKLLYDHIHNPQLLARGLKEAGKPFLEFDGVGDSESRLWNIFKIYWESRLTEPQKDTEVDANGKWTVRLPYAPKDADEILDLLQLTEEAYQALKKQPKILTWKVLEKVTMEEISAAAQIKTANGTLLDDPLQVKLQLEQKGQGPKEIVGVHVGANNYSPLPGVLNQSRTGFEVDMPPFGKLIYSLSRTRDGFAVLRVAPEVVWSIDGNVLKGMANNWGIVEVGLDPMDFEKLKTWAQMLGIPLPKIEKGQALSVWTDVDGKIHLVRVEEFTVRAAQAEVKIKKIIGPEEKLLRRTIETFQVDGELEIPISLPLEIPDGSFPHIFHVKRIINGDRHLEEFDVVLTAEKNLEIRNFTETIQMQDVATRILGSDVKDAFALSVKIAGNAKSGFSVREAYLQPDWSAEKWALLGVGALLAAPSLGNRADTGAREGRGRAQQAAPLQVHFKVTGLGNFDYTIQVNAQGLATAATRTMNDVAWDVTAVGDQFILEGISGNEAHLSFEGVTRVLADGTKHYLLNGSEIPKLQAWAELMGWEFSYDPKNHTHVEVVRLGSDWRLKPVMITGDILHADGVDLDARDVRELQDLINPPPLVGAVPNLRTSPLSFATEKYGTKDLLTFKPHEVFTPSAATLRFLKTGWQRIQNGQLLTTFVGPFYYELEAKESGVVLQIPVRFRSDRKLNPFEIVRDEKLRIYPLGGDPEKAVEITDPNLKVYNDGARWTIFLLTNRHGNERAKEWEIVSVISPDSPVLVGAINRLNKDGRLDELELPGIKTSAVEQIHQAAYYALGQGPEAFPPLALAQSRAEIVTDNEITLTFFSSDKLEYWATVTGVRHDKKGSRLLFDRYVELKVGKGAPQDVGGQKILDTFHYLIPVRMADDTYRLIEVHDDPDDEAHYNQPTGRYFEWIRHRGLFERRLEKQVDAATLKKLLVSSNIPVAEPKAENATGEAKEEEGDSFAARSRDKDGPQFAVNPAIPELFPAEQGYVFPSPNAAYTLLEGEALNQVLASLQGQSFLPTEETLHAQIINGRPHERMMFVAASGVLLVLPMEWEEGKRHYYMDSHANSTYGLEGAILLVPDGRGGYGRIPALFHQKRGARSVHLNLVIGPEEMPLHLERVSTTRGTLTSQNAFAFVVGDPDVDSAPLGAARQHLHEWVEENGLDAAGDAMGAKDYKVDENIILPDGNGFLPDGTQLLAQVKKPAGSAFFELEGLLEDKDSEGFIWEFYLTYRTPDGTEDLLEVYRDTNGGAYYLKKPNDPKREYLRVILSKDNGRPFFWIKGTNIKDFLNAPEAVDFPMIGRDGKGYWSEEKSVATRKRLRSKDTEIQIFEVRSTLGRWSGASGSSLAVAKPSDTDEGTVRDGAAIRLKSAQVRFKFRVLSDGSLIVDRAWLKAEGKGERFEICDVKMANIPNGRIRLVFRRDKHYAFMDYANREALMGADVHYAVTRAHYNQKNWTSTNLMPNQPGFLSVFFLGVAPTLRDGLFHAHPSLDDQMRTQLLEMQATFDDYPKLAAMAKKLGYSPEHPDWETALSSLMAVRDFYYKREAFRAAEDNIWPKSEATLREVLDHLAHQKLSPEELDLIESLRVNSPEASTERQFFWWHYLRAHTKETPLNALSVLLGLRERLGIVDKTLVLKGQVQTVNSVMQVAPSRGFLLGPVARFGTMAQIVKQVQKPQAQTVLPSSTAEWSENFQHTVVALNDLKAALSNANWGNFNGRRIQIMEEIHEILHTKNRRRLIQVALAHQENQCDPTVMGYAQAVALTMQNPFYLTVDMMRSSSKPAGAQQFKMGAPTPWTTGSGVRPVAPASPVLPVR